ncbi:hypothetical protein D3C76_639400 [compost metagenome]
MNGITLAEHQKLDQEISYALSVLVERIKNLGRKLSRLLAPLIAPEVLNQDLPFFIVLLETLEFDHPAAAAAPGDPHDVREQADHRVRADENDRDADVVNQVEEEIQHALLAARFRQMQVLQLVDEQGAYVKRTGDLFHLLQRIVDVPVPMSLVIILVTQGQTDRVEELLTEPT